MPKLKPANMNREMSRWGVGPGILVSAGAYAAVAGLATSLWPEVCFVTAIPYTVFLVAGIALLLVGIPMLVLAARAAMIAYHADKLATTGIFGLARNPVYSAWIVFNIPGIVLLTRSWPVFLTPLVAYLVFKAKIGRRMSIWRNASARRIKKYKAEVNELIPFSRLR